MNGGFKSERRLKLAGCMENMLFGMEKQLLGVAANATRRALACSIAFMRSSYKRCSSSINALRLASNDMISVAVVGRCLMGGDNAAVADVFLADSVSITIGAVLVATTFTNDSPDGTGAVLVAMTSSNDFPVFAASTAAFISAFFSTV
jgi:hypothetical protein